MALELSARGDRVAFLGQIDTDIVPPLDEDATEIHELRMFAKAYSDLRPSEEELRKAPQGRRLEYLLNTLKLQTPAFEYAQVARIAPVWQANRRAAWNFLSKVFARPEAYRYSGRITLFRALERPMMLGGEPDPQDGNWQAFSIQPVEVRHVPGKHTTCILEPHARHLAGELMLAMEDFQPKF
jgi:thioesterase domain-containing protein